MISESAGQLIQILEKTVSPDKAELERAQQFLEQAAQQNFPEFVKALSDILYHGGNSPVARMAAGLQLKNTLTSRDTTVRATHQKRWLDFPPEVKEHVRRNILAALGTENNRPSSAAQCVAYIAIVELPQGQWADLISVLVNNVIGSGSTEIIKEASLEAVGYICQDIEPEVLAARSNEILTAIIHGMKRDEPSTHVRLAATNSLLNSLEFTKSNFEKDTERHYIMEVVCEATQSTETQIRVAAMQCLVKIMTQYYQYMETYMGPALFAITLEAMKSDVDEVALQGIEFWSSVCDEEVDLDIEAQEAADMGRPPEQTSRFYAKGALQYLTPVLMERLTKQEDCDDEEDWNPSKAAGVSLMLLAACVEDDIVPHVLPFVTQHIKSPDWKFRDAALMAFGSILEGPDGAKLKPLVEQVLPILMELMQDPQVAVKDTAAWTIGRVCELIPDATLNEAHLPALLECLVAGLQSEPRVATNVCWAISALSERAYESAQSLGDDETSDPETYWLSKYFEGLVERLLETTGRADGNQSNLRSSAYEALMEMMKNSPKDCYATVQKTVLVILERLQHVLQLETHITNNSDRAQYNDLQSLLCATLSSVLRKVTPEDAPRISDQIMTALLQMFSNPRVGSVQEDALNAVSTLAEVLGEGFIKYLEAFKPYLLMGLRNHAEYQVCSVAVGLVGDICRAVGNRVLPHCDEIMNILLENLGNQSVHRSVKPHILTVFGDIALAIGGEFKKYLDVSLQTLMQASQAQVDRTDYEMVDYLNELRETCLDAYSGIIQGLKGDSQQANADVLLLQPHVAYIIQFICVVASDQERSDSSLGAAAGLLGDLLSAFGHALLPYVDNEAVQEMLTQGRRSKAGRTKTLATWATKELKKMKAAGSS